MKPDTPTPADSPADPYIHCKQCGGIATDVDELRQHVEQAHRPANVNSNPGQTGHLQTPDVNTLADAELDEILERIENYYTMKYGMDYEENEKPMSKDEAKAALSLWKQRAVVAELESLKKSWTYGADGFARTDAYEQLNDRIQQLTVQPDKPHGASDVPQ